MKRIILPIPLLLALAACDGEPVAPPTYQDAVRVDGWYYLLAADRVLTPDEEALLGPAYTTVRRRVECAGVYVDDRGVLRDECGLETGDATDLAPGTALRPLEPMPPAQRLVAVRDGRLLVFHVRYPLD